MGETRTHRLTLNDLRKAGLPVVPGRAYVRKAWLPKRRLSLAALHRKLATFRGSLAGELARARDEG
jgi:hypothetical protein